jgi:hypothetical protein
MLKKIDGDGPVIVCDLCERQAPPRDEITKAHGLNRMGWHCTGGSHICPGHEHPERLSIGAFPKPGRTDFGTALDAITYAVEKCPDEAAEFLRAWQDGALEEWPEFLRWLDLEKRK